MTSTIVGLVREPLRELIRRRTNIRCPISIVLRKDWRILTKMLTKVSITRVRQARFMIVVLENTTMEISTEGSLMKKKIETKMRIITTNLSTIAMSKAIIIRVKIGNLLMKGGIGESAVHHGIESREGVRLLEVYPKVQNSRFTSKVNLL